MKRRFWGVFFLLVLLCCVGLAVETSQALAADRYRIIRWAIVSDDADSTKDCLAIDVKNEDEEELYYGIFPFIGVEYRGKKEACFKMVLADSLPVGTRVTVPEGWRVDTDPWAVDGKGGQLFGERSICYEAGATITLLHTTEMTFRHELRESRDVKPGHRIRKKTK